MRRGAPRSALRRRPDPFLLRWFTAVAVTLVVAGLVEYAVGAQRLRDRLLTESLSHHEVHVPHLVELLAEQDAAQAREAVRAEMQDIVDTGYGTTYAALFTADGELVAAAVPEGRAAPDDHDVDPALLAQVVATGEPVVVEEQEEGETDDAGRYEFLVPVRTPDGRTLALEVDQHDDIIGTLAADLRGGLVLGVLVATAVAVPLSYLLGGRGLHRAQRSAEQAANADPLTGLAGRRPFHPDLEAALHSPGRTGTSLALVDVDEFKQVNDRLGHSYGDHVLVALAVACREIRSGDTAYRLGGDEFAVVLRDSDDATAVAVVARVRQALTDALPGIGFSCGVASVLPSEPVSAVSLWERADAALYEAKRTGRGRTSTFADTSSPLTISPAKVAAVHRLLVDGCGLRTVFQPIWDLRRGELLGHEALLRLPAGSPLTGPSEAFELAQRLGCAAELDRRARETVVRTLPRTGWHGRLFVNVHPDALPTMDLEGFAASLASAGLDVGDVVLEVTEQADLDHPEPVRALRAARALGFRLALDDMGRSNAGLRALTLVHFDVIKVDRQVVADLGSDPAAEATVAAATTFVQRTGGWVVAEGIEDVAMLEAVTDGDGRGSRTPPVLAGQGYLLGRPELSPLPVGSELPTMTCAGLALRR